MAWGRTYKSEVKQNQIIRMIFFATVYGKETESAKPQLNLLDILSVHNVHCLHVLKFTHLWHRVMLPGIFGNMFRYARNVHSYNTIYVDIDNLYKSSVKTNIDKQTITFMAIDLWKNLPLPLKLLNTFSFTKHLKAHLLTQQRQE